MRARQRALGVPADEDVARLYRRLGFRRIATALIAERPTPG